MIMGVSVKTRIRRMRIDDLPRVRKIDQISFTSPWPDNAFRYELLDNSNGYCWVAESNKKLVGFAIYWLILDEAHIATLAIHPENRGQGISKILVKTGLCELITNGALMATLEVRAGNKIAQSLYHHFGFKEVGLRKGYYQDTKEDAILMTVKPLDQDYLEWLKAGAKNPWNGNRS